MSDPTTVFQLSLPRLLLNLSPPLAALHAVRARRLHPSFVDPTHCTKCGSFLLSGDAELRIRRLKPVRTNGGTAALSRRVLQASCHVCGYCQHVPLERGNASLFPRRDRRHPPQLLVVPVAEEQHPPVHEQAHRLSPPHPPEITSSSSTCLDSAKPGRGQASSSRLKNRPKKRSGLQDMLVRNREKEEKDRQAKQNGHLGLAAFLDAL